MGPEPRANYSSLLRQNPSEFSTQYPVTFEVLQSGWWERAVALCVLGTVPLILSSASLALGHNCMCWLYSAVIPGGPLPISGLSLCPVLSSWHSVIQSLAALVSLDFSSVSSGHGIHQVCLGSLPCPAPWGILVRAHRLVYLCLSGRLSVCCLLFSVLKTMVSNVLSGCLVVSGGTLHLVPVIASWLEAESLICVFLPRRTFPILNGLENSTVWMVLTLTMLTA